VSESANKSTHWWKKKGKRKKKHPSPYKAGKNRKSGRKSGLRRGRRGEKKGPKLEGATFTHVSTTMVTGFGQLYRKKRNLGLLREVGGKTNRNFPRRKKRNESGR